MPEGVQQMNYDEEDQDGQYVQNEEAQEYVNDLMEKASAVSAPPFKSHLIWFKLCVYVQSAGQLEEEEEEEEYWAKSIWSFAKLEMEQKETTNKEKTSYPAVHLHWFNHLKEKRLTKCCWTWRLTILYFYPLIKGLMSQEITKWSKYQLIIIIYLFNHL